MKRIILTAVVVLTMATGAFAETNELGEKVYHEKNAWMQDAFGEDAPKLKAAADVMDKTREEKKSNLGNGLSGAVIFGINTVNAFVGAEFMNKNIGVDAWQGGDKFGGDVKVSVPIQDVIDSDLNVNLVAEVGVAFKDKEPVPAGGARLTYTFPVENAGFKGFILGLGYHTEKGINTTFGLTF